MDRTDRSKLLSTSDFQPQVSGQHWQYVYDSNQQKLQAYDLFPLVGTWGPFGRVVDTEFIMDPGQHVPAHLAPYMGLLYFSGCRCVYPIYEVTDSQLSSSPSDQMCIRLLRATFAGYLGPRRATEIPHTQSSGIRSAFTRYIFRAAGNMSYH